MMKSEKKDSLSLKYSLRYQERNIFSCFLTVVYHSLYVYQLKSMKEQVLAKCTGPLRMMVHEHYVQVLM